MGSERSQGRPINLVQERMKNIEFVLKDLYEYQKDKTINEDKKAAYIEKISILEQELQLYKQINIILLCKQNEEDKIIDLNLSDDEVSATEETVAEELDEFEDEALSDEEIEQDFIDAYEKGEIE